MKKIAQEKRHALLLACKDSDYVKKWYNGCLNVFLEAFGDKEERWDLFRVVEGEFPYMEDLNKYEGFIVSGSPHDAYNNDLWILRWCLLIQTLDAVHKRVLGICFGHQVLCRALGGEVGKACGGWDIGIRKVIMVDELRHIKFFDRLKGAASSSWSRSDRLIREDRNIGDHVLGIQGHPEYNRHIS